ncbi:MAG TPA: ABC transporter substrate-binding protein [Pyrinomonadaceae bacterium]|jgi:iron complex transport system substrate-binding protein
MKRRELETGDVLKRGEWALMKRRRRGDVRASVAILLLILVSACGGVGKDSSQSDRRDSSASSSSSETERAPQRIISLSPSATEILYGVGAFGRVVAVSDYCDYPAEVKNLPRVGGWNNPNLEQIAALRPDLVVFAEAQSQFVKDKIEALGIRALSIPSNTLEDAFTSIEEIGRATKTEREAGRLLAETRAEIDDVRARTRDLPRRRVLCVVDRVPGTLRDLYAATEGSFIAQLVDVAGGESIAPSATSGWGKITKEAVVALDPEVIIDMVQSPQGKFAEDPQAVWRELPTVRAIRDGRIHQIRDTSVIHPSQFVGNTARRFAEIIHPEAFAKTAATSDAPR